jgi:hypothetical protein
LARALSRSFLYSSLIVWSSFDVGGDSYTYRIWDYVVASVVM